MRNVRRRDYAQHFDAANVVVLRRAQHWRGTGVFGPICSSSRNSGFSRQCARLLQFPHRYFQPKVPHRTGWKVVEGGLLRRDVSVDDISSQDDAWSTSVLYFSDAIRSLSLDVAGQIAAIGGPNAAWELRQDAIDFGSALIASSNGRLAEEVEHRIHILVVTLQQLPEASYQGNAAKALNHPQWHSVRCLAKTLLARIKGTRPCPDWP